MSSLKVREKIAVGVMQVFAFRLSASRIYIQCVSTLLDLRLKFVNRRNRRAEEFTGFVANWKERWSVVVSELETLTTKAARSKF
jgi:hypothetical protein